MDQNCLLFNRTGIHENRKREPQECSWPTHFYRWLKSLSHAKIEFYHNAVAGTGPDFVTKFVQREEFTRNDIIIVDYSKNFGLSHQKQSNAFVQLQGMEEMIRTVLSKNHDNHSSAFILKADYPYCHKFHNKDPKECTGLDNLQTYHKVGLHYHLPVWLSRDLIWSDIFKATKEDLLPYIRPINIHPLFHHHLFYAEITAALFQLELHRAYEFSKRMVNQKIKEKDFEMMLLKKSLPKFLTELKTEKDCDSNFWF